jgi:hypothetical protein
MPFYVCSLPNPGEPGVPRECIADDPQTIEAFAQREDKPGRGVYDCVSALKPGARRRSLRNVGEIAALHVDIDGKDLAEELPEIDRRLARLLLPPTEIRNSGRGRHVRYELKEPIDATDEDAVAQATEILRRLSVYLCGDMAVAHHAALLRRPGTHNSKGGGWAECVRLACSDARYDLFDIADWLADVGDAPLFTRHSKSNGKGNGDQERRPPIDVEARLAAMEFEGAGENSIHQTQLSVTASLLRSGITLGETTRIVLEATRVAVLGDPRAASWNWRREERKILRMGAAFIGKNPELAGLLPDGWPKPKKEAKAAPPPPKHTLAEVHAVFRQWFGEEYDLDVIDAVLATAASERLTGDPLWLLVISGPGNAKTETVQSLSGAGGHVTSTIASEGALLSATPRRERNKNATGGLLRKIGPHGLLVIKDVTSILSADRNVRGGVLAAIREIYDGRWERNVGTDGGQTLTWAGRLVLVGAVTTAWDSAHSVVAAMGDRFVLIRADSRVGRRSGGLRAICNTGDEVVMRQQLAAAVGGIVGHLATDEYRVSATETDRLVKAADIVTMARTAVERDYQGEVIDAHAPEMPTRFAKQLAQMVRGAIAIGITPDAAMRLALRCARDSIPPLRREILLDIAANPGSTPGDVRKRIGRPWRTVKREMEALLMLRLLQCVEELEEAVPGEKMHTTWRYSLADAFDCATLLDMSPPSPGM